MLSFCSLTKYEIEIGKLEFNFSNDSKGMKENMQQIVI
jgi:hypothetical protein